MLLGVQVQALNYLVTMQRYSSSSYRQRLPVTIAAAFESWSRRVESAAYDYLLHVEGKLILMACEEQLRQAKEQSRMMHAVVGEVSLDPMESRPVDSWSDADDLHDCGGLFVSERGGRGLLPAGHGRAQEAGRRARQDAQTGPSTNHPTARLTACAREFISWMAGLITGRLWLSWV